MSGHGVGGHGVGGMPNGMANGMANSMANSMSPTSMRLSENELAACRAREEMVSARDRAEIG